MKFFDQKEEVIDLQLTQYGKFLISKGTFKPVYYAFFDDDVIYDQRYVSGTILETQKNIENRILEKTPRSKTQYLFHSVDQLEKLNELQRTNFEEFKEKIQQAPEKHYASVAPLGNSYLLGNKAPAFKIRLDKGIITSSAATISGSGKHVFSTQKIPQLDLKDVAFFTIVRDSATELLARDEEVEDFPDGTYLEVKEDYLLFSIEEENVPITKDNFDLEVFVLDQSGNIDFPLSFMKKKPVVKNGILLDAPDPRKFPPSSPYYDTDMVEYYFDLRADNNIPFKMRNLDEEE